MKSSHFFAGLIGGIIPIVLASVFSLAKPGKTSLERRVQETAQVIPSIEEEKDSGKARVKPVAASKQASREEFRKSALDYCINAIIEIESSNNNRAKRYEAHINDSSYGSPQILTRTALDFEKKYSSLPRISNYPQFKKDFSVLDAQKELIALYGEKIKIGKQVHQVKADGKAGAITSELLKRIQRKHNLKATGTLDSETWEAIQKERHIQEMLCNPQISRKYAEAIFMEAFDLYKDPLLAVAAYNSGLYTPRNSLAMERLRTLNPGVKAKQLISDFQRKYGLKVRGRIDNPTWEAIRRVWKEKFPGSPDATGKVPANQYTPNHVERFKEALKKEITNKFD